MAEIHVLSKETIDQIAAGEVVERPSSVVKELVENAIDAGSTYITVEIKSGGIEFIRVTDNGMGIEPAYIRKAFLRHATSKIVDAKDLSHLNSLGFRGEALSSVCAVSRCEVITKTKDTLVGIRYLIEGGEEVSLDEIGCPDGTTIIVRNLFYNVPVRRKFLKSATAEGSAINDLMEHLALSNPQISFQFINNNKTIFSTSGNDDLKEVIYRIFGKDTAGELLPVDFRNELFSLKGYIGKPEINRSTRNFEVFFINNRYVKNDILSRAVEEGFKNYLMQHCYPFCVLNLEIAPEEVDVNVHPTKMEIRFISPNDIFFAVSDVIYHILHKEELIPNVSLTTNEKAEEQPVLPQAFEAKRLEEVKSETVAQPAGSYRSIIESHIMESLSEPKTMPVDTVIKASEQVIVEHTNPIQMNMFEERLLDTEKRKDIQILGQVFKTFWLLVCDEKLYIVDQHAAHEKVKYERFMRQFHESRIASQEICPGIILTLSAMEAQVLNDYADQFAALGFSWEDYGGNEIRLNEIPYELYGYDPKDMFLNTLDELSEGPVRGDNDLICQRIATMSCKAAVKGNNNMTFAEMESLIDELLKLEDPYHCPHGRPTIITMTKSELEKKFKRIV